LIPESVRRGAREGEVAEVCPAGLTMAGMIGERIVKQGGAALIVDYGHTASAAGDTLQALSGHRYSNPFQNPGEADLTAHVDFAALASSASEAGAAVHGPIAQRDFLLRLGIETRANQLLAGATPAQAESIRTGCERLIGKEEMGYLFKVMAITAPGSVTPAAFEEPAD
jgi:SAM-dependent MidA family methyltransferase